MGSHLRSPRSGVSQPGVPTARGAFISLWVEGNQSQLISITPFRGQYGHKEENPPPLEEVAQKYPLQAFPSPS